MLPCVTMILTCIPKPVSSMRTCACVVTWSSWKGSLSVGLLFGWVSPLAGLLQCYKECWWCQGMKLKHPTPLLVGLIPAESYTPSWDTFPGFSETQIDSQGDMKAKVDTGWMVWEESGVLLFYMGSVSRCLVLPHESAHLAVFFQNFFQGLGHKLNVNLLWWKIDGFFKMSRS